MFILKRIFVRASILHHITDTDNTIAVHLRVNIVKRCLERPIMNGGGGGLHFIYKKLKKPCEFPSPFDTKRNLIALE